jgi:hypothetical protein
MVANGQVANFQINPGQLLAQVESGQSVPQHKSSAKNVSNYIFDLDKMENSSGQKNNGP